MYAIADLKSIIILRFDEEINKIIQVSIWKND